MMLRGYFKSPDGVTITGVEQLQIFNCGPIPGGYLVFALLKIGDYPEVQPGEKSEVPDAAIGFADPEQLHPVLLSLLATGTMSEESLAQCPPSQRSLYEQLQADPRDWDTLIALYGSLLSPAYLAGSWDELMECHPALLVVSVDDEGNEYQNIRRCSLD